MHCIGDTTDDILYLLCLSDINKKVYETVKSKFKQNFKKNIETILSSIMAIKEGESVYFFFTDLATLLHGILHLWRTLQ